MKEHSITLKPTKNRKKWLVNEAMPDDFKKTVLLGHPYGLKHYLFPYFASLFSDADEIIITAKYKETKDEDKKT